MTEQEYSVYEFGEFRLNVDERQLLRNGVPVSLTNKAFDLLSILVQRSGHLVRKSELIDEVWQGSFVEPANVIVTISVLRKTLGENPKKPKYIETVAKEGYRFVAKVRRVTHDDGEAIPSKPLEENQVPHPSIHGRKLAYFILGFVTALLIAAAAIIRKGPHAASSKIHSLIVVPFQTPKADSSLTPISESIANDLAARLDDSGQIDARLVVSKNSDANGRAAPIIAGRERKADAVLTGSMIESQGHIRVTAKLIDVNNRAVLWRGVFEQPSERLLALEEHIDTATARFLFPGQELKKLAVRETKDPKAYRLYAEGLYFWNKRTADGFRRSVEYFQRAIARDPHYAEAYAGLASSYDLLASYGVEPASKAYPNAEAAARKAIELDPSSAAAYTSLGMASFKYEWNWEQAKSEFRHAIALNPNYVTAHAWYALVLAATGERQQAVVQSQRALQLNPVSLFANSVLGFVYFDNHQYGKAIAAFKHVISLNPNFAMAHRHLGLAYAAEGDYRDAIAEFERARVVGGPDPYLDGDMGYAEGRDGNSAAARRLLHELLVPRSNHKYVPAFAIALIYLGLNENGPALHWLTRAYDERSAFMAYSYVNPLLNPVRSDPAFVKLMARLDFTQSDVPQFPVESASASASAD